MVKKSPKDIAKWIFSAIDKNSPQILTGVGVTGMLIACVSVGRATIKATKLVERQEIKEDKHLSKKEVVGLTWKLYVPAAIMTIASSACLICSNQVNTRRNAALMTMYSLSESALNEYRDKAVEILGEKKAQTITDAVAQDKVVRDLPAAREVIIAKGGDVLFMDSMNGRPFRSDVETLRKARNNLNYRMMSEMYVSLNDFYDELDLSHTDSGELLGWNISKGMFELSFSAAITPENEPCMVVSFIPPPEYKYAQL